MGWMTKALSALLIATLAVVAAPPPASLAAGSAPAPAATATPPPTIYHVITRPLCSELHQHIAPAVGMMLQNDAQIKKSPALFSHYNMATLYGNEGSAENQQTQAHGGVSMQGEANGSILNPSQNIALLGMENLISPIANNIIAIQKLLDSPALTTGTGNPDDDKRLQDIRTKLLKALAVQNAALDIISGFVDTQNMADLQHSGQEFINGVNQPDSKNVVSTPTPNPLLSNPNQAGIPTNPYEINLANVPGLTLGYNPTTRLIEALHWTIDETTARENAAANAIVESNAVCSGVTPSH